MVASLPPAMIAIMLLCALPALWAGSYLGVWTRFLLNRNHYDRIVTEAKARKAGGPDSEFLVAGGVTYIIDYGPPVRIAFNPDGILDNWSGIIFDPSGEVLLADGFDSKTGAFFTPERITKLFGGDLVECRHLSGKYYHCWFT